MMTKTIKLLVVLLLILNTGISRAEGVDPEKNPSDYAEMLYKEIRAIVEYPQFAHTQKLEGFVLVSYEYDQTGKLQVLEANSNSLLLKDYVVARLSSIELCSHARQPGKVYNMRFDFRLI